VHLPQAEDVVSNPVALLAPSAVIPRPVILVVVRLVAAPRVDVWVKGRKPWKNVLVIITGEKSGGSSATSSSHVLTPESIGMGSICASPMQDIFRVNNSSTAAICLRPQPTPRRGSASTRHTSLSTLTVAAHSALMAVNAVSWWLGSGSRSGRQFSLWMALNFYAVALTTRI